MQHVLILGGGSFSTALAQLLARRGVQACLYVRSQKLADAINATHQNPKYLSEFTLHPSIWATAELHVGAAWCDTLFSGLPSHALRSVLAQLAPHLSRPQPLIIGTKGIEGDSLMTMDAVARDVLGAHFAPYIVAFSGPSFAREMMLEQPTAVVLACENLPLAQAIAARLFCDSFRAYCSSDVIGVEVGGALKNVMALAAGALVGMGLGDNSRAGLITRGIAEMRRLAVALGAEPLTLMGLAGIGDLVLTCTGALSRNRAVGEAIGRGQSVEAACRQIGQIAEGIGTTKAAHRLAQKLGVEAPITGAVYQVLYEGKSAQQALLEMVRRKPGRELSL